MKMRKALRMSLLVTAMVAVLPLAWALDVHAQGATTGAGAMQQEVRGMIKDLDPSGRMLTLDDGTQLTIPPTVQLPQGIKEGSIVKASFEERAGQKVVTALEVQTP
jgi:Cu/Ag efflux protein CusF